MVKREWRQTWQICGAAKTWYDLFTTTSVPQLFYFLSLVSVLGVLSAVFGWYLDSNLNEIFIIKLRHHVHGLFSFLLWATAILACSQMHEKLLYLSIFFQWGNLTNLYKSWSVFFNIRTIHVSGWVNKWISLCFHPEKTPDLTLNVPGCDMNQVPVPITSQKYTDAHTRFESTEHSNGNDCSHECQGKKG